MTHADQIKYCCGPVCAECEVKLEEASRHLLELAQSLVANGRTIASLRDENAKLREAVRVLGAEVNWFREVYNSRHYRHSKATDANPTASAAIEEAKKA